MKREHSLIRAIAAGAACTTAAMAQTPADQVGAAPRIETVQVAPVSLLPPQTARPQRRAIDIPVDAFNLAPMRPAEEAPPADGAQSLALTVGYIDPDQKFTLTPSGWSQTADGGRVCAFEFHCEGAYRLRLRFAGPMPNEMELRTFSPTTGEVRGPIVRPLRDADENWWSPSIAGDVLGVEFYLPPESELAGEPVLPSITAVVVHNLPTNPPQMRGCDHQDRSCHPAWQDQSNTVCMTHFYPGDGTVALCSASILGRSNDDGSPIVATANHCVGPQSNLDSTEFIWFFDTDACNGDAPEDPHTLPMNNGARILSRHTGTDMTLLGLFDPAETSWRLGWDANNWGLQADATGIHHPSGTFKKISFGDNAAAVYIVFDIGNDPFGAHVWHVGWDDGTISGGSSGSPVMDSSHLFRGTLSGGTAENCSNVGYYGRFTLSFDHFSPFIWDLPSPAFVDGDHGGAQRGTSAEPFNQVHEATYAVPAGDEVRIRGGTYNERLTLWRPLTLNAESGVVRIGE